MVGFLIAVLSGVLMSVQGIFNTQVTKASSIWSAQIAGAYLVGLFGLFGVEKAAWEWRKAIGLAVAAVGIAVFQWK